MRRLNHRPYRASGLSLLETLIAIFVMLSAFTVVGALFMRSTQSLVQVEEKVLAVAFGETMLDDIRTWAKDPTNFAGDWSSWNGSQLPTYPGFRADIRFRDQEVFTPCPTLESDKPAAEQQRVSNSLRQLDLQVRSKGRLIYTLSTLIPEPPREADLVVVTIPGGSTTLAKDGTVEIHAALLDTDGNVIPDVPFQWAVIPGSGNGTIARLKTDRARAEFTHVYRRIDGRVVHVAGKCVVQAEARYRGRKYSGRSEELELRP